MGYVGMKCGVCWNEVWGMLEQSVGYVGMKCGVCWNEVWGMLE